MKDINIKLSAIWVSRMLIGFLGDVTRFFEPGMMEQILVGEIDGMEITNEFLLISSIVMALPIIMVFLSLVLKDRENQKVNIGVAILILIIGLLRLFPYNSAYAVFLTILGIGFNILTIGYSWKWLKENK